MVIAEDQPCNLLCQLITPTHREKLAVLLFSQPITSLEKPEYWFCHIVIFNEYLSVVSNLWPYPKNTNKWEKNMFVVYCE